MPKKLVVCCDGTWNVPDEVHGGVAAPTNVAKLALGVATGGDSGQLLFYEPGVGTRPDEHLLGGAFGLGLSRNVLNAYEFLCENYDQGDTLFLFGFSRGAYTARSLGGLIRNCGILRRDNVGRAEEAFAFYRDRTSHTHPSAIASQLFRSMYAYDDEDIHFIGVWDTVGALGIPDDLPGWEELGRRITNWQELWGFHDTQLSSHVRFAYHALAIDEQRKPFRPTLWTSDDASDQTVEQVWFAGVHTEVGGGARDPALSDIALLWMVEKAVACGLELKPGVLTAGAPDGAGGTIAPDYRAPIVDSRHGFWEAIRPFHRLVELPVGDAPGQWIASSADRRLRERVAGYAPPGIDAYTRALEVTPVPETGSAPGG
jgi:uncharacterized protein (DUF2235 family)